MSETGEINENKTENDYLELGDCFKEIVQKKDRKYRNLKQEYIKCFKLVMMAYSSFRMLDNILEQVEIVESVPLFKYIVMTIQYIRSELSTYIDELNDEDTDYGDDDDEQDE